MSDKSFNDLIKKYTLSESGSTISRSSGSTSVASFCSNFSEQTDSSDSTGLSNKKSWVKSSELEQKNSPRSLTTNSSTFIKSDSKPTTLKTKKSSTSLSNLSEKKKEHQQNYYINNVLNSESVIDKEEFSHFQLKETPVKVKQSKSFEQIDNESPILNSTKLNQRNSDYSNHKSNNMEKSKPTSSTSSISSNANSRLNQNQNQLNSHSNVPSKKLIEFPKVKTSNKVEPNNFKRTSLFDSPPRSDLSNSHLQQSPLKIKTFDNQSQSFHTPFTMEQFKKLQKLNESNKKASTPFSSLRQPSLLDPSLRNGFERHPNLDFLSFDFPYDLTSSPNNSPEKYKPTTRDYFHPYKKPNPVETNQETNEKSDSSSNLSTSDQNQSIDQPISFQKLPNSSTKVSIKAKSSQRTFHNNHQAAKQKELENKANEIHKKDFINKVNQIQLPYDINQNNSKKKMDINEIIHGHLKRAPIMSNLANELKQQMLQKKKPPSIYQASGYLPGMFTVKNQSNEKQNDSSQKSNLTSTFPIVKKASSAALNGFKKVSVEKVATPAPVQNPTAVQSNLEDKLEKTTKDGLKENDLNEATESIQKPVMKENPWTIAAKAKNKAKVLPEKSNILSRPPIRLNANAKQAKISDYFHKVTPKCQNLSEKVNETDEQTIDRRQEEEEEKEEKEEEETVMEVEDDHLNNLSQELSQISFNENNEKSNETNERVEKSTQVSSKSNDCISQASLGYENNLLKNIYNRLKRKSQEITKESQESQEVSLTQQERLQMIEDSSKSKYFKQDLLDSYLSISQKQTSNKSIANALDEIPLDSDACFHSNHNQSKEKQNDITILKETNEIETTSSVSKESNLFCDLPIAFHSMFKTFDDFNDFQKIIFNDLIKSNVSLAIAAPTGCGKTVAFELAIIKLLIDKVNEKPSVVMISPLKAICKEKFNLWKMKFEPFNLKSIEITGDSDFEDFKMLSTIDIFLTTPEKFDSLSRKRSFWKYLQNIKLILIDEIHTISDEVRGPILETLICRLKQFQFNRNQVPRFVMLSATYPNVSDVSQWISNEHYECKYVQFGEETRPVKLKTHVLGFNAPTSMTDFLFDQILNKKLPAIISQYSKRRPVLIFCSTRKTVEQSAKYLAEHCSFCYDLSLKQTLNELAFSISNAALKQTISKGIAFHHAGLAVNDRNRIQDSFEKGLIPVLLSTSTLATGVNLPAHLVIIKNTFQYVNGVCRQYDETQITQMIGRAGRPQFDTEATAVIMTRNSLKAKFENYLDNSKVIESQLHQNLAECLNTEIHLGIVTSVKLAVDWIKSTFLYVRMKQKPAHYGYPFDWNQVQVDAHFQASIESELKLLVDHNLIEINEEKVIESTPLGRIMAEHYISLQTMKQFFQIKKKMTLDALLDLICKCKELTQEVQIRNVDKETLNRLNFVDRKDCKFGLRFPLRKPLNTNDKKINCLLQAFLGCSSLSETHLYTEALKLMKTAGRLSKALFEYMRLTNKSHSNVANALILCKSIRAGIWENSPHVFKQFPGIGITMSSKLMAANYTSFKSIASLSASDLEYVLNKHPPFGCALKQNVEQLPNYEVIVKQRQVNAGLLKANIDIEVQFKSGAVSNHFSFHSTFLLVGNEDDQLLLIEQISDSQLCKEPNKSVKFSLTIDRVQKGILHIDLISDRIVGIDQKLTFQSHYQGQRKRLLQMDPDDRDYLEMQFPS